MRLLGWMGLMVVALAGCESEATPTNDAAKPKTSSPMPTPEFADRDLRILGSYELVFDGTNQAKAIASIGNPTRIDVEKRQDGRFIVVVTPRWGHRHPFTAVRKTQDESIIFEGGGDLGAIYESVGERDRWFNFQLERELDGRLNGFFTARGVFEVTEDGKTRTQALEGHGRLFKDRLAPEIRIAPPLASRGDKFLPWDAIDIETAEPLPAEALIEALQTQLPERTWAARDLLPDLDPEIETARVHGTPITEIGMRKMTVASLVKDPSGNELATSSLDVNVHAFDASDRVYWGGVEPKNDGIVLPPIEQQTCVASGAAGHLPSNANVKKVKARVRFRVSDPKSLPSQPKLTNVLLFALDVPFKAHNNSTTGWGYGIDVQRTGSGELPWDSGPIVIGLELMKEAPLDKIGFAFTRPMCDHASALKAMLGSEAKVGIEIEAVWTE